MIAVFPVLLRADKKVAWQPEQGEKAVSFGENGVGVGRGHGRGAVFHLLVIYERIRTVLRWGDFHAETESQVF